MPIFRARRFIGSGDRRAVSDRVWSILRRYGQLRLVARATRHPDRGGARHRRRRPDAAVEASPCEQLEAMFDGGRYRPAPLDDGERRALRQMEGHSLPHPEQPDWVRLNVQEWVAPHLQEAYGEAWGREIAALETPPPVDLRVNRLKATVEEARAALHREGIETEPMRYAPRRPAAEAPAVGRDGPGLPGRPGRDPGRGLAARGRRWSTPSPACRSPTIAPAPAARRWRSPPA